ncbi:MAG: hypothetical protein ACYCZ4_05935 [Sulfuricella sp.]
MSLGEISHIVHQPGLSLLTTNSNRYSLDVLAYRNIAPISILSKNALAAALVVSHIETGGQSRHSGESRNPEKSTTWTPAFAGVTVQLIHAFHRD